MALLRTYSVLVVHDGFTEVATGDISLKFIRTDQLDLSLSHSGPFGLGNNANNLPKAAAAAIAAHVFPLTAYIGCFTTLDTRKFWLREDFKIKKVAQI